MLRSLRALPLSWLWTALAAIAIVGVAVLGLALRFASEPPAPEPAEPPAALRPSSGYVIVPLPDGSLAAYAKFTDPEKGVGFRGAALPPPGADLQPPVPTGEETWLPPAVLRRLHLDAEAASPSSVTEVERWGVDLENGRVQLYAFRDVSWTALVLIGVLVLGLVALALGLAITVQRLRRARHQRATLALAQRWKEAAREAERARLAREIHDGPLQDLHALRMRVALPSGGDGAAPADPSLGEAANAVALELRGIAEGLRPPALSRFGLGAALEAHARRLRQRSDVTVAVEAFDDADRLSEEARTALFRIGQEAISNAVQHGHARTIRVRVWVEPSAEAPARLCLTVTDDGVGLDDLDTEALVAEGHFGVAGMRERAALLGASFSLASRPEGGTRVALDVPWLNVAAGGVSERPALRLPVAAHP